MLSLQEFRGKKVLLVFTDPHCGPCDLLLPELEQLQRQSPEIQVLLISRGGVEENRRKASRHRITLPLVLQKKWEISKRYAMFATPMAYLIDENGTIAAEVAAGPEAILTLLSSAIDLNNGRATAHPCRCGRPKGKCQCGKQSTAAAR